MSLFVLFQDSKLSVPDDFPRDVEGVVEYLINLAVDRVGEDVTFDVLSKLSLGKSVKDVFQALRWSKTERSARKRTRTCLEMLRPILFPLAFDLSDTFLDENDAALHGITNQQVLNKFGSSPLLLLRSSHLDLAGNLGRTTSPRRGYQASVPLSVTRHEAVRGLDELTRCQALSDLLGSSRREHVGYSSPAGQEASNRRVRTIEVTRVCALTAPTQNFLPNFSIEKTDCCHLYVACELENETAGAVTSLELTTKISDKIIFQTGKVKFTADALSFCCLRSRSVACDL
eukprot:766916-Hanusia_phi.AAC.4